MGVREGLLVLLSEEPKHGYQLKGEFEDRTGAAWSLNVGQVYTTLDRLTRSGLVRPDGEGDDGDDRRKRYAVTDQGREELRRWFATPAAATAPPREELLVKVLLAVGAPGVDALEVIGIQRDALVEQLQEHRARQRSAGDLTARARMVADALAVRREAEIRWLDLCEERLVQEDRAQGGRR